MATWSGAAVVFDLDGVLIDADAIYERHWRRWADAHGIDLGSILAIHHGRPSVETMRMVAPYLDVETEAARFNEALEADPDDSGIRAYAGAHNVVAALHDARWAIATSAPRSTALSRLSALGIAVPRVVVTIDDVPAGKPAPDPYLAAAAALGVAPDRCLVVEDAPAGIASSRAAGAYVLAVATTHPPERLGDADGISRSLGDLDVSVDASGVTVRWPDIRDAG
ncbi:MAG: HAD-IA family hydrolase [Acidimicrobiia bacterium]|nr:HAD-IA family hydrolase [Acidimicrobiia bacterium]